MILCTYINCGSLNCQIYITKIRNKCYHIRNKIYGNTFRLNSHTVVSVNCLYIYRVTYYFSRHWGSRNATIDFDINQMLPCAVSDYLIHAVHQRAL